MTRMEVYFADECPRIGSGRRVVEVQIGRKWVRFRSALGNGKVAIERWRNLARTAVELAVKPRRRRARRGEPTL